MRAQGKSIGALYTPFIAIVLVQIMLAVIAPSNGVRQGEEASGLAGGAFDDGGVVPGGEVTDQSSKANGSASGRGTPTRAAGGTSGATPLAVDDKGCLGGICGLGQNGLARGLDPKEAGEWPWTHSWKLKGDRSRCGKGGTYQDDVLLFQVPCIPDFTGNNGGATWTGVTKDTVVALQTLAAANPAVDAALSAADLSASPEEMDAAAQGFTKFFNKHYEYYGRTLKVITVQSDQSDCDDTCTRNEIRAWNKKYKPFFVFQPNSPAALSEWKSLGVITSGGWMLSDAFRKSLRPFNWDLFPSGDLVGKNAGDYWCKKMVGKDASRAGDPTYRLQKRKLGIVVNGGKEYIQAGKETVRYAEETCGTGQKIPVFTYGGEIAQQQEQANSIAIGLKDEAVTTVACVCDLFFPVHMTRAFDNQNYLPEHLIAGQRGIDNDMIGRLYSQTQWANAFGPGFNPFRPDIEKSDFHLAYHDAGAPGEPRYVTQNVWNYLFMPAMMMQWAGPNLTPYTMERGAFERPQTKGWVNPKPWPGWKCCDPRVSLWEFSKDSPYTAEKDAKEVYWDPSAISEIDGRPGAYICSEKCRRYRFGTWPKGEPLGGAG